MKRELRHALALREAEKPAVLFQFIYAEGRAPPLHGIIQTIIRRARRLENTRRDIDGMLPDGVMGGAHHRCDFLALSQPRLIVCIVRSLRQMRGVIYIMYMHRDAPAMDGAEAAIVVMAPQFPMDFPERRDGEIAVLAGEPVEVPVEFGDALPIKLHRGNKPTGVCEAVKRSPRLPDVEVRLIMTLWDHQRIGKISIEVLIDRHRHHWRRDQRIRKFSRQTECVRQRHIIAAPPITSHGDQLVA